MTASVSGLVVGVIECRTKCFYYRNGLELWGILKHNYHLLPKLPMSKAFQITKPISAHSYCILLSLPPPPLVCHYFLLCARAWQSQWHSAPLSTGQTQGPILQNLHLIVLKNNVLKMLITHLIKVILQILEGILSYNSDQMFSLVKHFFFFFFFFF